jgi:hypothetical protein
VKIESKIVLNCPILGNLLVPPLHELTMLIASAHHHGHVMAMNNPKGQSTFREHLHIIPHHHGNIDSYPFLSHMP